MNSWWLTLIALLVLTPVANGQNSTVRERLSFNWRFKKDDPAGTEGRLSYEKIKDRVTATGNEFATHPEASKRSRPQGSLGEDVSDTKREFDEQGWRKLSLPHDWGTEGPFRQEYPGETGKLAWWGVGWYRKHFQVSTKEKGKQFYLDID